MAGGRRNVPKSGTPRASSLPLADDKSIHNALESMNSGQIVVPKHIILPDIPVDSELVFEAITLLFGIVVLGTQYLNLYRTVWWLPHSHTAYAINFYLIDPHVVAFSLLVLGRCVFYCLMKQLGYRLPSSIRVFYMKFAQVLVVSVVIGGILWCTYKILVERGPLNILCIGYPVVVHLILFGATLMPLFEFQNIPYEKSSAKTKVTSQSRGLGLGVYHTCSLSPEAIRDEVDMLKTDFNNRLKHVLFNSLLLAYYSAFIPCCFAQSALHYDIIWAAQHVGFAWFGSFTMYVVFYFPPRYCDTLHRAALHLGRWQQLENRNAHVPYNVWSDSVIWQQGSVVKHMKEFFKAEGISNAAEPGNATHARFYAVFSNPVGALSSLLGLQVTLIIIQMVALIRSSEWNYIISVSLLLLMNCLTLFKVSRAYFVLGKIYHCEQLQEKLTG